MRRKEESDIMAEAWHMTLRWTTALFLWLRNTFTLQRNLAANATSMWWWERTEFMRSIVAVILRTIKYHMGVCPSYLNSLFCSQTFSDISFVNHLSSRLFSPGIFPIPYLLDTLHEQMICVHSLKIAWAMQTFHADLLPYYRVWLSAVLLVGPAALQRSNSERIWNTAKFAYSHLKSFPQNRFFTRIGLTRPGDLAESYRVCNEKVSLVSGAE